MRVLYFAWVRERIGEGMEEVDTRAATLGELADELARRGPRHAAALGDRAAIRGAVDHELAPWDAPHVRVGEAPVDAGALAASCGAGRPDVGGVALFEGRCRADEGVVALEIEHYPGMTEAALARMARDAAARFGLLDLRVAHRVGRIDVGETIVAVACAAPGRGAALEGAGFLMDWLKSRAPFWKREVGPEGARGWVAARGADEAALARWEEAGG